MSILIKGMEMPQGCDSCWALDDYGDYPRCRITNGQRGYNFPIREKRMGNCPLVPVPPHGRLIDADALEDELVQFCDDNWAYNTLRHAPTIIEAEEGE